MNPARTYDVTLGSNSVLTIPTRANSIVTGVGVDGLPYILFSYGDPAQGGEPILAIKFETEEGRDVLEKAVRQLRGKLPSLPYGGNG